MTNQNMNESQEVTDVLATQAANDLRKQLALNYVSMFHWGKAIRIIWSTICFLSTIICFRLAGANLNILVVAGSFCAVLFMMSIHGMPLALRLDKPSQERFERWLESQRETT